jgi:monoamine oxidase
VTSSDTEVVIIGGGAAGIAAGRRLADARVGCLIVEARSRLGGRAWTTGAAFDLGCGWLHSADRNPWYAIAVAQGRTIDKAPPPWQRPSASIGFPLAEQAAFLEALRQFYQRLDAFADDVPDVSAATFLAPHGRWNELITAVGGYVSGAELDRLSARHFPALRRQWHKLARGRGLRDGDRRSRRRPADRAGLAGAADRSQRPPLARGHNERLDNRGRRHRHIA